MTAFELDPQVTAMVAVGAAELAVLLAIAVLVQGLRLRTLRRRHERALGEADGAEVLDVIGHHGAALTELRDEQRELAARAGELRELLRGTVSRVGLVRYDAFEDMGGALSFSAALLDERGDGLVLSAINGRSETRCYVKPIAQATSEHNLSVEETTAIDAAVRGERVAVAPTPSRRRRRAT